METTIEGICKAMDAKHHFRYEFGPPELTNNDAMVDIVKDAAKKVVGEEGLVDLVDPVMGGEDFSGSASATRRKGLAYLSTIPVSTWMTTRWRSA
ncbi:M20/M25/M40 family metallo-hydrolase [Hydrogenimonas sp.]